MRWSVRMARVAGIDIRVHLSFVLILALGAVQWGQPHGPLGAAFGVALMVSLFACVVLHELGHALVARRFGIGVRQILLLPIGGVSELESEPKRPGHELLIAVAGPLVNVGLAAVLLIVTRATVGLRLVEGDVILRGHELGPSPTTFLLWLGPPPREARVR